MTYSHTQRAPMWLMLVTIGLAALAAAWLSRSQVLLAAVLASLGVAMMVVSLCFGTLTVADQGDWLLIRFGPLPVFQKRIAYARISHVEPSKTAFIDGWGVHYIPGRGWTWNLWGWDCVRLTIDGGTMRIGTDDADNLARFIRAKINH